ncbi:GNAT family N-acetyltransferase [Saccharospirillum alexandrii]|uniref:GNAT family N-acetyltransferase n=1 Tax=Saccharospirillum alexandrii TaxID=2448477 RepID=UPI003734D7E2
MNGQELTVRIRQWLRQDYRCCGIIRSGLPIAYALYRNDGDCFYLRQLFTARAYRNQGLASELLRYFKVKVL